MERRDLYNKYRVKTGETVCKGEQTPKGKYIIVVITMIQNSKGEFLVQKRAKQKNGLYAFTGGHAKSGETGLQGAITEVKEEIGLDIKPEEMTLLYTCREDYDDVFFDLFYTKKDVEISKLQLQEEEVESIQWCSFEEIDKMIKEGKFFNKHSEELYRTTKILEERKQKKNDEWQK